MAENMLEVGNLATQVGGGLGYLKGNLLERAFRDLRSAPLHTLLHDNPSMVFRVAVEPKRSIIC
jgi:alkylation response protein AidB-like acyl-CoA dehydrogenase